MYEYELQGCVGNYDWMIWHRIGYTGVHEVNDQLGCHELIL